jgi:predicted nucleotide-binding protein
MPYHVRISRTDQKSSHPEVEFDLTEEELRSEIVEPYLNDSPIFIRGATIPRANVGRILITFTEQPAEQLRAEAEERQSRSGTFPPPSVNNIIASMGNDVTRSMLRPVPSPEPPSEMPPKPEPRALMVPPAPTSRRVFLVFGHNQEIKLAVENVLRRLDFVPIILEDEPNRGQTISDKLDTNSNVDFAVVCLSADDIGYSVTDGPERARSRARQNVVFELGYFIGKLDRGKVLAIHTPQADFEMPTDYAGVIYISYDNKGAWIRGLARELRAAGFDVDLNKLS